MSQPLVSAVIPAYNCGAYIGRAIESVLTQTYRDIECIVINDGSTDDTATVARSYGERVVFVHQPNGGASAARNTGIRQARGELLAFLDADDYWLPTKTANQVQVFRENPKLVLVSSGFAWTAPTRAAPTVSPPYDAATVHIFSGYAQLLRDPYLGTPTVMVTAEAARRIGGFDTSLPVGEDVDFYFRLCDMHPYARIDQCLAVFQIRADSLTKDINGYSRNLEVLDRIERMINRPTAADLDAIRALRLDAYRNWVTTLLVKGQGNEARRVLKKSAVVGRIKHYPRYYLKTFIAPLLTDLRRIRSVLGPDSSSPVSPRSERGAK